jgi:hypothetical protein
MPQSAQSEAARAIRHISIELRKNGAFVSFYTFILNPEDLTQSEKPRAPVTQTLTSAYVNKFGLGLPEISFSGTTGFNVKTLPGGGQVDGYERFHTLRREVFRKFFSDGPLGDDHWQMFLYQWEDAEFWEVFPTQFDLQRNVSKPLLYRYTIRLLGLRKLDAPVSTAEAQNHAATLAQRDPITSTQQNAGMQVKRAYDDLLTANQLLRSELGARFATLTAWRATWRSTSTTVAAHVDNVTQPELFNETNYPGTNALNSQMQSVLVLQDQLLGALKPYLDGANATINLRLTAAQDLISACRSLLTALENLQVKPISFISFLQDAVQATGILQPYVNLFRTIM